MKNTIEFALLSTLFLTTVKAQASCQQWYVHLEASLASFHQDTSNPVSFRPCAPCIGLSIQTHFSERNVKTWCLQRCGDLLQERKSGPIGVMLEPVFLMPAAISRNWVPHITSDSNFFSCSSGNFFSCSSGSASTYNLLGSRSAVSKERLNLTMLILMFYNRPILSSLWPR